MATVTCKSPCVQLHSEQAGTKGESRSRAHGFELNPPSVLHLPKKKFRNNLFPVTSALSALASDWSSRNLEMNDDDERTSEQQSARPKMHLHSSKVFDCENTLILTSTANQSTPKKSVLNENHTSSFAK